MLNKLLFNLWYFQKPPWDTGISPPELMEFIDSHPPGWALDLGCGTGTNGITLAKCSWEVTGVDFAWRAVQMARRKARRAGVKVDFRVDDVTRLNKIRGPFDLILDMGCFHNLPFLAKGAYQRNLGRLLADEGTFLLYGFFRLPEQMGPGMIEADIDRLARQFRLVKREDGYNRGGQPSAWLTFEKL